MDKNAVRTLVWKRMRESGIGLFPYPIEGRIPNFKGAQEAAKRLFDEKIWNDATTIKINPDSPQRWIRQRALEEGKTLYMAVPRLSKRKCFIRVKTSPDDARKASSIKGAFKYGFPVHPSEMKPIDLMITGSVAVNHLGERIGKGGGYSDLEVAIVFEFGLIDSQIPIATTVHDIQTFHETFVQLPHDITINHVFTPTKHFKTTPLRKQQPIHIDFNILNEEQLRKIPILRELKTKGF